MLYICMHVIHRFSCLKLLKTLAANSNRLDQLPEAFECCSSLQTLLLSHNLLTEVPPKSCFFFVLSLDCLA